MVIKGTYQNEEVPLSAQLQFKNMLHQVHYCYLVLLHITSIPSLGDISRMVHDHEPTPVWWIPNEQISALIQRKITISFTKL